MLFCSDSKWKFELKIYLALHINYIYIYIYIYFFLEYTFFLGTVIHVILILFSKYF
ncbi:MAG: hypothetical protein N7Q72_06455 [Spiroplasma sp. Tabriz.8]|nr:hypothetical protein [Spiroplasma sp. Tabriz.8]